MALEDVVQGVQVTVKTDGVDEAKDKIGQLDKAVGDLAKTAGSAAGGGGAVGGGIGGLNKAFSDLNMVGSQAFATIARSAASGDLTGLATLMGGPVAGSFVEAGKSIVSFIETQDSAILKNAAMAREFGTTPAAMQGIKEGFEGAGVSATGFERLVNRMSRQVQNDYAEMTRNIRTDSDTQEAATLRLQAAREKLAISKGADPASFQYQDKLREQKFAQIAVDQAEEDVRQKALKSIPHVTDLLSESARAGKMNADITEVSTKTLRESIENMARVGEGPASPVDVLKKEAELIKSGAIDIDTAIKLLKDQGGMSRAAGLGGMDAVHEAEYFKKYGASGIEAAQAGKSIVAQAGLGTTAEDTKKATETISEWSRLTGLINAAMQKIAAYGSGEGSELNYMMKGGENVIKGVSLWYDFQRRLKAAFDAGAPTEGGRTGWAGITDAWDRMKAAFSAPKPEEKIDPKTGKPVGTHTEPWRENVGSGPAQIIHVPEGWTGHAPVTKPTEESVGSGPAKMIHLPEHYNEPGWKEGQPITRPYDAADPRYQHMSVSDAADAPWRSLRGPAAPATPPAAPTGLIDWFKGLYRAPSEGASAVAPIPGREPLGAAAPVAAPVPPTVNVAAPTVNVAAPNVTVPISVTGGATATAGAPSVTPATSSTIPSAPEGHWGGGAIRIPGFAQGGSYDYSGLMGGMSRDQMASDIDKHPDRIAGNGFREFWNPISQLYQPKPFGAQSNKPGYFAGGMIPGFAEGGPALPGETDTEKYLWEKVKQTPAAVVDTLKDLGPAEAKKWLISKGIKYGVEGLIAAAGFTPQGRVIELGAEAMANVLEPVTVGAADYNAGAKQEEEAGRRIGAHNLGEADALRRKKEDTELHKRMAQEAIDLRRINSGDDGMWSGGIPGFAMGSIRGPGNGTSDSILARLSNGEFVMKDAAVRTYGEGFMHAINNMQIPPPKYAIGGMVPSSSLPQFAGGGGMERPGSILNLHVGGEVFKGLKAPAAVADQLRKFAIDQQTSQTGRKPSWAGA